METTKRPTTQSVINALESLAKELKCPSILVEIKQWIGSSPYVYACLYSAEKNPNNGQHKWSISAETPEKDFSIDALILKLRADYLECEERKNKN